ncbi:hypothetical protein [Larkinella punicea]|uniref:Uncharacterized protein n=1 Tax=Larkinella punicea TaxID=2315727 RepID=A0A368JMM1_9BACT|nr:hypothetical protein [Larkinella punicea]RCR68525.1 hypothetical protein DUE52_15510 [Larkinella punicea]
MNQTFNFYRFGLVLKLHLSEHLKTYLLGAGVLFGIWSVLLLPTAAKITVFSESIYRNHTTLFGVIYCGAGAWFASELFRTVSTPVRGIPYLTLPASRLEKFLVVFVMMLLFIPVFIGVFYAAEGICFSIINARLPAVSPKYQLLNLAGPYMDIVMRYLTLITPSFFLVGSIYFTKVPFVKTAVIAFCILFSVMLLNSEILIHQFFPGHEQYGGTPFREVFFLQNRRWYHLELSGNSDLIVKTILLLAVPSLWYIAFTRFKEKEL